MPYQVQSYAEALSFLYKHLPQFAQIGKKALTGKLDNIEWLCQQLDHPQSAFKSIHIAGTNGKGSTSHLLTSIYLSAQYNVGTYTSPHLFDFRERIKINGHPIAEDWVVHFVQQYGHLLLSCKASFFEATVAMAFLAFKTHGVDIAIIETGLGGRLDSTNIVQPILSIITNIGYDHKDVLGDTLSQIAEEKAGIIKPQTPILIGERQDAVQPIFTKHALLKNAPLYNASDIYQLVKDPQHSSLTQTIFWAFKTNTPSPLQLTCPLTGDYQVRNICTALAAVDILNTLDILHADPAHIQDGVENVLSSTGFMGRWQILHQQPLIIMDVGHNEDGIRYAMAQWQSIQNGSSTIVCGFMKDKAIADILHLFPKDAKIICTQAHYERALPAVDLQGQFQAKGYLAQAMDVDTVAQLINQAIERQCPEQFLLIGSFYLLGDLVPLISTK